MGARHSRPGAHRHGRNRRRVERADPRDLRDGELHGVERDGGAGRRVHRHRRQHRHVEPVGVRAGRGPHRGVRAGPAQLQGAASQRGRSAGGAVEPGHQQPARPGGAVPHVMPGWPHADRPPAGRCPDHGDRHHAGPHS